MAHRAGWQVIAPLATGPVADLAASPLSFGRTNSLWSARSTPRPRTLTGTAPTSKGLPRLSPAS
eukprot:4953166-Alexandrium_andersonii.AAC.1